MVTNIKDIQPNQSRKKVKALQGQIAGQKKKVAALGGKPSKGGPSVLSRVFDVLQRGQYATATLAKEVVGGEKGFKPQTALGAITSGLAGRSKTSFSHVLEEAGVKNKLVRGVGGFVGDVLLDPTTYIGVGAVKAVGKGAAKTAGLTAMGKTLAETTAKEAVEKAGKEAVVKASEERIAKGTAALTSKQQKRLISKTQTAKKGELGRAAYETAHAASLAEKPGSLALKFAGKELVKSEKAYKGLANLGRVVGDTKLGGSLNEAFRTASTFPESTNKLRRMVEQAGIKHYENDALEMRNFFRGLTQEEKRLVSHALESGNQALPKEVAESVGERLPKVKPITEIQYNRRLKKLSDAHKAAETPTARQKIAKQINDLQEQVGEAGVAKLPAAAKTIPKAVPEIIKVIPEVVPKTVSLSAEAKVVAKESDENLKKDFAFWDRKSKERKLGASQQRRLDAGRAELEKRGLIETVPKAVEVTSEGYKNTARRLGAIDDERVILRRKLSEGEINKKTYDAALAKIEMEAGNIRKFLEETPVPKAPSTAKVMPTTPPAGFPGALPTPKSTSIVARLAEKLTKPAEEVAEEIAYRSTLHGQLAKNGKDLGEYVDKARELFGTMFDDEVAKDIFRDKLVKEGRKSVKKSAKDFKLEDYVYHFYKGGTREQRNSFKNLRRKAVGTEIPTFTKQRLYASLEEAKTRGLKPVEEIDDILALRMGKHHQALARRNFVHGVKEEYGVKLTSAVEKRIAKEEGFVEGSKISKYIEPGTYLPQRIADTLKALEKMHTDDDAAKHFLGLFDKAQNHWKFLATAANPGHHSRNMVGDIWNNFLDGVTNPDRYRQAGHLLASKKPKEIHIRVGEISLDGEKFLQHNIRSGAAPGYTSAEFGKTTGKGAVKGRIVAASEKREEWARLAHFIDAFKDEGKHLKKGASVEDIEKAANAAAVRVRHWNIDYADMTRIETQVMKRAIPFYTWTRKNIPLQIEALAMRPGRVAVAPKGMKAIETMLGTEGPTVGGPDVIPKWIKELSGVRLQGEGEGKNARYWVPALPFDDIGKYLEGGREGIGRSILSQISPLGRIPIEQTVGEQLFSGAPIKGDTEYFSQQIPALRTLYRATKSGEGMFGRKLKWDQFFNYVTGMGVYDITPESQLGELRRQQDPLQQQIRELRKKPHKTTIRKIEE